MGLTKVLVIDKFGPDFSKISKALRPFGLGVLWTETIEEGLELLRAAKPSLVIMADDVDSLYDPARV
ncbi:MAG: hypothetical protein LBV23_00485, partial [Deltaproteobacteria bacterium]|nr:hypothetical protein [Deltaproteobacteria bacterium]